MRRLVLLLALALLVPVPAAAQDAEDHALLDGEIDSSDEVMVVTTARLQESASSVLAPIDGGTPIDGPTLLETGSEYFDVGIRVSDFDTPSLGTTFAGWFHHDPADYVYYGETTAFVVHQLLVDVGGPGWQETWPYLEFAVFLSKDGVPGAVPPDGVDNDPGEGAARVSSVVWVNGEWQSVVGFADGGPMDLFENAYRTTVAPLDSQRLLVSHWVADPTWVPTFTVSWGDGATAESVGFVALDGEAPGTQDPVGPDLSEDQQSDVIEVFATKRAPDAGADDPPDDATATPDDEGDSTESEAESGADAGSDDPADEAAGATDEGDPTEESEPAEGVPVPVIVAGVVIGALVIIGGTVYFLRGARMKDGEVVLPTAGEDRTERGPSKPEFRADVESVPLESAAVISDVLEGSQGLPGAPLSTVESLLTRAEAAGLPKTDDGWQLLEFDLAYDALLHSDNEVDADPERPGSRIEIVSTWDLIAPPGTPIDGTQVGIWHDEVEGFRVGSPTDPHAFVTPPEHALPPELPPEDAAPTEPEPTPIPEEGAALLADTEGTSVPIGSDPYADPSPGPAEEPEADHPPQEAEGDPWWGDGPPPVGPRPTAEDGPDLEGLDVSPDDDPHGVLEGLDAVDMALRPATVSLLAHGETGMEADALGRLEDIIRRFRGTGDIAGVAQALYDFNEWHTERFDEPWFEWTNDAGDDTLVGAATTDDFFMSRRMSCFEFVHFCAYLASDQLARPRMGQPGEQIGESPDWGLVPRVFTADQAVAGGSGVPAGWVVTGVAKYLAGVNTAGYTHIVVSIGNDQVIGLGTDGLEKETVDECFGSWTYEDVQHAPYGYGAKNPAPAGGSAPPE